MTTILVTGATGNVGSTLVPLLHDSGAHVRALVHDKTHAAHVLGADADLRVLHQSTLTDVLCGVDAVYLACGNVPEQPAFEKSVIDAAARTGVHRVVKLSARGAAQGSPVAFWDWHADIERHLLGSGVPATVLQPSFLMTNLLAAAGQVRERDAVFAPAGRAGIAMVDPADVAAAAATTLTDEGHEGRTYVLTGPEVVGYDQVADVLSSATGREIGYVDVPGAAFAEALGEAGAPAFVVEQMLAVFEALRRGDQATTTDALPALLGRPGRSLADFVGGHAAAFGAEPARSLSR